MTACLLRLRCTPCLVRAESQSFVNQRRIGQCFF
jgi:hypothetical protein